MGEKPQVDTHVCLQADDGKELVWVGLVEFQVTRLCTFFLLQCIMYYNI